MAEAGEWTAAVGAGAAAGAAASTVAEAVAAHPGEAPRGGVEAVTFPRAAGSGEAGVEGGEGGETLVMAVAAEGTRARAGEGLPSTTGARALARRILATRAPPVLAGTATEERGRGTPTVCEGIAGLMTEEATREEAPSDGLMTYTRTGVAGARRRAVRRRRQPGGRTRTGTRGGHPRGKRTLTGGPIPKR